jgi:hypothetical protein
LAISYWLKETAKWRGAATSSGAGLLPKAKSQKLKASEQGIKQRLKRIT